MDMGNSMSEHRQRFSDDGMVDQQEGVRIRHQSDRGYEEDRFEHRWNQNAVENRLSLIFYITKIEFPTHVGMNRSAKHGD